MNKAQKDALARDARPAPEPLVERLDAHFGVGVTDEFYALRDQVQLLDEDDLTLHPQEAT